MYPFKITQFTGPLACGEAPHWDSSRGLLYLVDIPKSLVLCYDPESKTLSQAKVDAPSISFILPVKGTKDKFVVGAGRSIAIITWDGISPNVPKKDIEILVSVEADKPNNRFNDGKCDNRGRVFAGTMSDAEPTELKRGAFYSIARDRKLITQVKDVSISNGMAWTEDNKTLYYADSLAYTVDAFDYNIENGTIANRRVVFDLKKNGIEGVPDGMTIDRNGDLWIALYLGSAVICVNPRNGRLVRKLPLPGRDITSVAFIGNHLDQMIVTGAYKDLPKGEAALNPQAGTSFIITGLGVQGYVGVNADI